MSNKYNPTVLVGSEDEAELTPILKVLLKVLDFEPEYPETKLLLKELR